MSDLLTRAAQSLEDDPTVMASALAVYRRRTGMDAAALERWLGLAPGHLPRLALCRRPDPMRPTFDADVAALAVFVGCAPERLRELLDQLARVGHAGADATA